MQIALGPYSIRHNTSQLATQIWPHGQRTAAPSCLAIPCWYSQGNKYCHNSEQSEEKKKSGNNEKVHKRQPAPKGGDHHATL